MSRSADEKDVRSVSKHTIQATGRNQTYRRDPSRSRNKCRGSHRSRRRGPTHRSGRARRGAPRVRIHTSCNWDRREARIRGISPAIATRSGRSGERRRGREGRYSARRGVHRELIRILAVDVGERRRGILREGRERGSGNGASARAASLP